MQLPDETQTDLEPIQYQDLYHEDDVPLGDVRQSALRLLVYAGAGLAILLVTLGATVRLSRQLTFDFVLKGERQERVYRFFEPVYLEERLVQVSDEVAEGQPLLRVRSPEIVALMTAYEDAVARRQIFETSDEPVYQSQIDALRLEEAQLAARIEADAQRKTLGANVFESEQAKRAYLAEQAAERFERSQGLFDKNLISEDDYEAAREAQIVAENDLATLRERRTEEVGVLDASMRVDSLEQAITRAKRREKENELQSARAALDLAVEQARQALERNYGPFTIEDDRLTLLAPHAGRVSFVVDENRDVEAGTTLLKILNAPDDLYAFTTIPPQDIGLVDAGDDVVLKVSTFPHYEWGAVRGQIRRLSLTPNEQGLYPCEVQITDAGRLAPHLQIGMTGALSVLVEERSFFGYVFSGFERRYHDLVD